MSIKIALVLMIEDSELMTINHLAGIKSVSVHPELFELIELGNITA